MDAWIFWTYNILLRWLCSGKHEFMAESDVVWIRFLLKKEAKCMCRLMVERIKDVVKDIQRRFHVWFKDIVMLEAWIRPLLQIGFRKLGHIMALSFLRCKHVVWHSSMPPNLSCDDVARRCAWRDSANYSIGLEICCIRLRSGSVASNKSPMMDLTWEEYGCALLVWLLHL